MSETTMACSECGQRIEGRAPMVRYGDRVMHKFEGDCIAALRAALAAATAREAKPLPAGLATVEALLDYIQSAGVEQPDPIRQRLHAALAAHTECVVRWCMDNPRTTFEVDGQTYNESWRSYLARALAAAKGGQND